MEDIFLRNLSQPARDLASTNSMRRSEKECRAKPSEAAAGAYPPAGMVGDWGHNLVDRPGAGR
jgi:hypothetical protein